MARIFLIIIGLVIILTSTGCQSSVQKAMDPNMMQVQLIDANSFPQEMVGSWYNQQYGWTLKFEPDGRLLNITHAIGLHEVSAGRTETVPLKKGGKATFSPGPWLVRYDGKAHELVVEITLKSFDYQIIGNTIKGSSRDVLIGTLPKPGETTWRANWVSFPEYIFSTANKAYKDYRLPVETENEDKGEIIFEKFDPEAIQQNQ